MCYNFCMTKLNFDSLMLEQAQKGAGGRLLLHCCCAPCASACLERLKEFFKITVFFYNPNIEDGEYERRKAELLRFTEETGWADFMDCGHGAEEFYSAVSGLEDCPEGGERCAACFGLRLKKTYEAAKAGGYDFFTTTLTISPLKNAEIINSIGKEIGGDMWLYSDFKKRNGYLRSCELSKEHNLYRQNYCGCVFSERHAEKS